MQEIILRWDDLTPYQKEVARNQYIYIRSIEDEISEDEARKIYDISDDSMRGNDYFVDEDNNIFVNI